MTFGTMFGGCDLYVPHKDWAGDTRETQNYEALEQWSMRLRDCVAARGGGSAPSSVSFNRVTYIHSAVPIGFPSGVRTAIPFNILTASQIVGSAITAPGAYFQIAQPGFLMWTSSTAYATFGTNVNRLRLELIGSDVGLVQRDDRFVNGQTFSTLDGGGYFDAGTQFTFRVTQYSGVASSPNFRMTVSLLGV